MNPLESHGTNLLTDLATKLQADAHATSTDEEMLRRIVWAEALERESRRQLQRSIADARARGISWQGIGGALGVSRQAAFKRFDRNDIQSNPEHEQLPATMDLVTRTEHVFTSLANDDFESVKSLMTFACSRALTKRKVMTVWAGMVTSTGRFTSCSEAVAQTLDGRNIVEKLLNRHLQDGVAMQTQLHHESGEWTARVAYNRAGKITGILVAAVGSKNLAF